MKYIKHKVSGHEATVTDAEWEQMKNTPLPKNPERNWASGYKILQDAPESTKQSISFIPPEVKNLSTEKTSVTIQPTSPEVKTENATGNKKQQSKNKAQ